MKTIDAELLEHVTGGRLTEGPKRTDPALLQGIAQLADAIKQVGQMKAQAEQGTMQQLMQMMQAKAGR